MKQKIKNFDYNKGDNEKERNSLVRNNKNTYNKGNRKHNTQNLWHLHNVQTNHS